MSIIFPDIGQGHSKTLEYIFTILQLFVPDKFVKDSLYCKLHYIVAPVFIIITYFVFAKVMWKTYWISCIFPPGDALGGDDDIKTAACHAVSMYTVSLYVNGSMSSFGPAPRAGRGAGTMGFSDMEYKETVRYHHYYQFTPYILLIQIILFYTPRYFWKSVESGRMKNMLWKIMEGPGKPDSRTMTNVVTYVIGSLGFHTTYAFGYVGAEVMNLVLVLGQMKFLDFVTGGVFSTFGPDAVWFMYARRMMDNGARDAPFEHAFPTLMHCTFNQYGPSGNIIPYSGICTLPLNMVARIYFVLMWFYLMGLAVLGMFNAAYRLLLVASSHFRIKELQDYVLLPKSKLRVLVKSLSYGDWFVFLTIAKHLDAPVFYDLLDEIVVKLEEKKENA